MQDIEIMLSTVQKLHTDLRNPKENGLSEYALADEKMIILADEAHHLQVESTKKAKNEKDNWEWTIRKLIGAHVANYLLEFTATMDMKNDEISTKYKSKTLANYTLREFRKNGYSKEIYCASGADIKLRILQTLLLSEYRRIQFGKHGVAMKPIVLFKSAAIKKKQQSMQLPTKELCSLGIVQFERFPCIASNSHLVMHLHSLHLHTPRRRCTATTSRRVVPQAYFVVATIVRAMDVTGATGAFKGKRKYVREPQYSIYKEAVPLLE